MLQNIPTFVKRKNMRCVFKLSYEELGKNTSVNFDRLEGRTLRCGRSYPGSNPGHNMQKQLFLVFTCNSWTSYYKARVCVCVCNLSPPRPLGRF